MSININFNFKERKKEIIVILIYLVIFGLLFFIIGSLKNKQEEIAFDVDLAKAQYDSIRNSHYNEEEMQKELNEITIKVEVMDGKLPTNLSPRNINQMLGEIAAETGNIYNQIGAIKELTTKDNIISYEVKLSSISTTYSQLKTFIEYIENYKVKIAISQLDLNRTGDAINGSMTLVFYGEKPSEEAL